MTFNGCLCFDLTLIISHDTILFLQVTGVYGETNKVSIHISDKLHIVSNVLQSPKNNAQISHLP